jgi:hypothetical protein
VFNFCVIWSNIEPVRSFPRAGRHAKSPGKNGSLSIDFNHRSRTRGPAGQQPDKSLGPVTDLPMVARLFLFALLACTASASFNVKFELAHLDDSSNGQIELEVHPEWAPLGAARFKEMVETGFFKDTAFFRVMEGFMAQFGIHGDPSQSSVWRNKVMQDDPVVESNKPGYVSFATSGPNSRTTQVSTKILLALNTGPARPSYACSHCPIMCSRLFRCSSTLAKTPTLMGWASLLLLKLCQEWMW